MEATTALFVTAGAGVAGLTAGAIGGHGVVKAISKKKAPVEEKVEEEIVELPEGSVILDENAATAMLINGLGMPPQQAVAFMADLKVKAKPVFEEKKEEAQTDVSPEDKAKINNAFNFMKKAEEPIVTMEKGKATKNK